MRLKPVLRALLILIILSSNIGCDQVSKNIVRRQISSTEQISFMNNHFTLMKVENSGAFLSFGNSLSEVWRTVLLIVLPLIVLIGTFFYLITKKNLSNITLVGICFVTGGGIGNIYDRITYGSVTDFLHIDFILFETGIFNMADVSIMVGMTIMLLFGLSISSRDRFRNML
jgi:signal peptidase II